MSEPLEVLAMPRAPSDHPEGSTEWLIANLNSADDIDGMVAERLRALEAERDRLRQTLVKLGTYGFECEAGPLTQCKEWLDAVAE